MDNAGAHCAARHAEFALAVEHHCVHEGVVARAATGVDGHARGLVHNHNVVVFVEYFHGNIDGLDLRFERRRKLYLHGVARAEFELFCNRLAVYFDFAVFEAVFEPRARDLLGEERGYRLVGAGRRRAFGVGVVSDFAHAI